MCNVILVIYHFINNYLIYKTPLLYNNCLKQLGRRYAKPAPEPEDIKWKNMGTSPIKQAAVRIFFLIVIFVMVFFLSTPLASVTIINQYNVTPPWNRVVDWARSTGGIVTAILLQYLPFLLFVLSVLVPIVVRYSVKKEQMISRSSARRSVLTRVWIFLTLYLLILPSACLASFQALAEYAIHNNVGTLFDRLFLPSGGSFFSSLLLQAICFGSLYELYRPVDYIRSWYRRRFNQGNYDRNLQALEPHLKYEVEYSTFIATSSIGLTYCILSPMCIVCGFIYVLFRTLIQRNNMIFLYRREERRVSKSLQDYRSQMTRLLVFALVNLFIFLFAMAMFFLTKRYTAHYVVMFVMCGVVLIYTIVMGVIWSSTNFFRKADTSMLPRHFQWAYTVPCFVNK